MKKILTVTSVILLFACLTQGFTTPGHSTFTTATTIAKNESNAGNAPRFFRSKWQNSIWINPWQRVVISKADNKALSLYLSINNYWQANVNIDYVAIGGPTNYTSGNFPINSGNTGYASTSDNVANDLYISITLAGPTEDPDAIRTLIILDGTGYRCQEITGSGVYTFFGLVQGGGYQLWADTGGCTF
jgi:hypothetical protein